MQGKPGIMNFEYYQYTIPPLCKSEKAPETGAFFLFPGYLFACYHEAGHQNGGHAQHGGAGEAEFQIAAHGLDVLQEL